MTANFSLTAELIVLKLNAKFELRNNIMDKKNYNEVNTAI